MQKDYNENLRRKSTQFWKQVSNGLRTPLNVIKGTADIAQNEIYDIETVKEGLQKIGESSEFLLNVVNDIVDFVTIENNELEIQQQPFNLNTMITQFIRKYFNKAKEQQKHLDAQVHAVFHENLIGDEHRVEQILDCMLINSLKYTAEQDRLCFEIFETGISENRVSLRFTMTGTNRKMYDYLTGTVNGKVVTDATDLALYNSHYILLKMGGIIKVELDENQNSKIIIDMTFGIDENDESENTLFDHERILIVCDSRKEAEARGELLSEMKAVYSTAIDSEEALEMIGKAEEEGNAYSACVIDWNIQNFMLQEFINNVHNIFGNDMPLIAMAYDVNKAREQALKMGFAHVMDHTWFRSTICEVLMKNTQGLWKNQKVDVQKKKYDFHNKHILVAEDSPLNMEFIVHILANVHADVTCATNGIEAYNLFKQKPEYYFDCILMDVNMPGMDGYETAKSIRKTERADAGTIPIFALTANAFQSDIKDALDAGMNGHFSKPVDVNRMYEILENLFEKKSFLSSATPTDLLNKTIFGTEMFYLKGKQITEVEHIDELLSLLLGKNQAVGIMCGIFDEGLPICSASGFALNNLGYDAESFIRDTDSMLMNVVFQDDCEVLKEYAFGHDLEVKKLRFKHKSGSVLWFNVAYIRTMTRKGEKLWIASFRPDDESIVGNLCDKDYVTVSVLRPEENTIILEKGNETIYIEELKLRKKYNYESLLTSVFVQMHKEEDKEEFLHQMSMKTILLQLEQKGIYEFIAYQTNVDGEAIPIRYKYRYLDETRKSILLTQEYVENLAESDDVTSLLNEKGFYRNVKKILKQEANADKNYVLLYMNIKDFKSCNEMLGFANGNVLLRKFADFMEKSKLQPVCCARFHADQFCFLIEKENLNYDEISSLCYRKVNINGNSLNVRIHCGIYEIEDCSQDVSTMCDKAVLAAESITNEYAMPYYVFDDKVNKNYQNRVFVLNNLERAFVHDEFQVYYQPVCDIKTGRVCSAEALVRWIMPGGKIVSPGVFVPVLENKGIISKLDLLVADKVQQFIEERVNAGKRAVPVSINLSRMDFLNDTFIQNLQQKIAKIQINKSLFRYEVTESAYINVGDDGRNLIDEIRKNKSQIYIDDFGTGYSSLQNLMEIYFDVLKLDMYFIRRIGKNAIAEGVIDAAIRLCHGLGRKVIAEGVETEEQYRFLAERDCDYIQGYYFYKPMPGQKFARLLEEE